MSEDAKLKCRRCTGTDVVNIQGYILCRRAKVTSQYRVMEHLRHSLPHASDCGATLPAIQGGTLSKRNKVCLGRHTWGAMPVWGLGSPCRCAQLCSVPRSQTQTMQYHVQVLAISPLAAGRSGALQSIVCNSSWLALTASLRSEIHHVEPNPAANHSQRRVCAGKHQRQELVALAKHKLVDQ